MKYVVTLLAFLLVTLTATSDQKGKASSGGLKRAQADVAQLKKQFSKKTPDQLINALIPAPKTRKYGGYEYYYKFMTNLAIAKELRSRGTAALPACEMHRNNKRKIHEAINGRGDTVATLCTRIATEIKQAQQDAPVKP